MHFERRQDFETKKLIALCCFQSTARRAERRATRHLWVLFLCLCILIPSAGYAQENGSIYGTVTDTTGAVIPGAQVTIASVAQGSTFKTVTSASGDYQVPDLQPGIYNLHVSTPGYEQFDATGIVLRVARTEKIDAKLAVGAVTSEVKVNATGMGEVQTESAQVSFTITGKQITQLVLNGRDFTQLVTLSPGVVSQTGQDEGTTGVQGSVAYSINGGRTEYNNWEVDGSSIMDNGSNVALNVYPNVDAIAETQVLTSNYGAEYGRNASGTVISQTKSGSEKFHGEAFEFLRNNAFNARNYFQQTVPEYKKHDFGFTIGGPVYIPKLYTGGQHKTFFFYSEEWRRQIVPGQVFNQQVPSVQERSGNFSDVCPTAGSPVSATNYPNCPVNPASGAYYPNNQVPIDPNAQALLVLISPPNLGSGANSLYQASPTQQTISQEELFRIDHAFSDKLHGFYRFIYDSWSTTDPSPTYQTNPFPTVQNSFDGPGVDMVANFTYTSSPSLVQEFVADYTTDHIKLTSISGGLGRQNFTGNGFFNNGYGGVLPSISLVGGAPYGGGFVVNSGYFPWANSNPTYSYRYQLTKSLNTQTIIIGASMIAAQKNEPSMGNNQGTFTFSTSSTVTTGNSFADLLLGRVAQFSQTSAQPKYYNRYKIVEPYFQDNWRITPRLTLNLGIRLSLFGTYQDISDQSGNFEPTAWQASAAPTIDTSGTITGQAGAIVPGSGNVFNGLVRCGLNGVSPGCMTGHLFNPAPRLGFAYDVFGDGKLSVRGGYGVFFEHTNGNESNSEALEGSAPVVQTPDKYNFLGYTNAGGVGLQFPLSVSAIPTHAVWPYVQQYNLAVQGELPGKAVLQVAYVGSRGVHLPVRVELNQLQPLALAADPYAPGQAISANDCATNTVNGVPVTGDVLTHLLIACGNNANPYRPYLGLSGINHFTNLGQSQYDALQVGLTRYFGGLNGSLAYTYGHSIDDGSDGSSNTEIVNGYNPQGSLANSNFDERHVLEASLVYDLPFFKRPGLTHSLLGGWQISDITSFQTGTPFSINNNVANTDNAGTGNTISPITSYPDVVGNIHGHVAIRHPAGVQGPRLYNSDAFAAPRGLTYGDAGRNILNLPNHTDFDMGLFKNFAMPHGMYFEFRAEAFNVFNHTQWSGVNNNACYGAAACANSQFLTVNSAHNPRILQFAGKLFF